eukprot:GILK01005242.1.p1 GENE.GILK01005242.1~~GILK01005242.1.p1  ORF type:complete len:233 (+),score=45.17 GILK01005242.1:44-700(+)
MAAKGMIERTIQYVKQQLAGNDASHDWSHIERVWKTSKRLAQEEGIQDTEVVEMAALLHDIGDWKYNTTDIPGDQQVFTFLQQHDYDSSKTDMIVKIMKNIGFKEELGGLAVPMFPELAIVQDADRLDAIGAVGIARCFTFGGKKDRVLYDPEQPPRVGLSKEDYMSSGATTINHFHEKLLLLKSMMKTEAGRRTAERRHSFMESYLQQFYLEIEGKA